MSKIEQSSGVMVTLALRRLLRPVARLLIANGITLPTIIEILKQVLVEVAVDEFSPPDKEATNSRISVLTGVHRKDVRRLREGGESAEHVPASVSLGSRLVNMWTSDPDFQDKAGNPLALPRVSPDGASFEHLAARVSTDVRPRAMLDELIRLGIVRIRDDALLELLTGAFVPSEGSEEKLYYLARANFAHLSASVHNVLGGTPPFFERIVHYDSIPEEALGELRRVVEIEGMRNLRAVNEVARAASDPGDSDAMRFSYGVYLYSEPRAPRDDEI